MKTIEEKVYAAIVKENEKKLQKYVSKKEFDKDIVVKWMDKELDFTDFESFKLASKYGLIDFDGIKMLRHRFIDAFERRDFETMNAIKEQLILKLNSSEEDRYLKRALNYENKGKAEIRGYYGYGREKEQFESQFKKFLIDAVKRNAVSEVKALTKSIDLSSDYMLTHDAFELAVEDEKWEMLGVLLNEECSFDCYSNGSYKLAQLIYEKACSHDADTVVLLKKWAGFKSEGCIEILRRVLKTAVEKKNLDATKLLLDVGAEVDEGTISKVIESNDLKIALLFMQKGTSFDDLKVKGSLKMQKLVSVYKEPETFLNLDLVLTDEEVRQFKEAAMYGLMKRYKALNAEVKTRKVEEENKELVKKITEHAKHIERPNKEVEEKRDASVSEAFASLAEGGKEKE